MPSRHKTRFNCDLRNEDYTDLTKLTDSHSIPRNTFVAESVRYVISKQSRINSVIAEIKKTAPHKIRRVY